MFLMHCWKKGELFFIFNVNLGQDFKTHIAKPFSNYRENRKIPFLPPEIFGKASNGDGLQE